MKYIIQMLNNTTGVIEDDHVEGEVFDTYSAALNYADYLNSCTESGNEILRMSNPYEYEEDYCQDEFEYIVVELDEEDE